MKKNNVKINDELIGDLKKYASSVCVSLAGKVRDEMYEEAQLAIDTFYSHYDPLYYKRHEYNFKKNSFKKYYKNPHNSIVRGGVELTPYEMDDLYRADTEYIFNLVYLGYHGNVNMLPHKGSILNIPPVMEPDPFTILLNKRDYLVENIDKYKNEALNKAGKQQYSTLKT
jgi:hypothetical protein